MRITIIGAGNVGKTLGGNWSRKHTVDYLVRDMPDDQRNELVSKADVVVVATQANQAEDAVRALDLTGKVVVDCTNPIKPDFSGLAYGYDTSAGERVQAAAPAASVVKAFNTVGFGIMTDPDFGGRKASMLIAGDDTDAKGVVMELASDLGFEAVDAGGLQQSRLLEPIAMMWISLAFAGGLGHDFAFGLLKR